ncbi:Flp family type IVb pilin [Sphingomonas paeninsulae]|uniref:Flp family type IVb pilin n=1 Tax=Sphingomonas paeninsulae TaxID=2319844 RepID=A0A494THL6_SPHPE|nr:Flp family type IVb pilin [Sphingomonas paeninsulae]AYJ86443.1 Flp family type IVb pilin [Sphingomonas paeninsulae]
MINYLRMFVRDEEGVTAVEYAVLAVLIISAIVVALGSFGSGLKAAFDAISALLLKPAG